MIMGKSANEHQRGDSALAFKAGFWYVFGNFAGKAISFITMPIFARLMTASDYGEFSNFAGWVLMLTIVAGAELYNTLSRAYYDFKENYDEYISTVTFLGCGLTAVIYLFFLCGHKFVLKIVTIPEQFINILFVFLLFSFCRLIYYARERTLYRYKSVAAVTVLSLLIPTVVSIILVYNLPQSKHLFARIYGYYLTSSLIGVFCAYSLFKKGIAFKWQYCKYAMLLSLPLLIHYMTTYLLTSTNVIITKNISGAAVAAIVSIAHSSTHILTIFFQAISGALTTWLMDNLELGNNEKIRQGLLFYTVLLTLIVTVSILFAPELIYVLGGEKYVAAISLLPGLIYATFIQSVTTIFTIILTYDKNVVKTAVITGIFSLISIVLKIWLMPEYGLMVLVYVNIAVFGILFVLNFCLVKQAGYDGVVSISRITGVIIAIGILTFLSARLYELQGLRYAIIGIFIIGSTVLLILNKHRLSDLIQIFKKTKKKKNNG